MIKRILLMSVSLVLLFSSASVWAQLPGNGDTVLIRKLTVDGFLLRENKIYKDLAKHYRLKRVGPEDITQINQALLETYQKAGYVNLVIITSTFRKGWLNFHVALSKQ